MAWAVFTDVRCYYKLLGQGDPLLMIPGLGVTSRIWDPVAPQLAQHFALILPDNRGVGRSRAFRPATTLADFTSDLIELLDYLQVERANVLGLSLGGVIALQLAVDHPQRINRLVLASCTDRFTPYLREVSMLLGQTLGRLRSDTFARTVEVLGSSPRYVDSQPNLVAERLREKCEEGVSARAVGRQLRCLGAAQIDLERNSVIAPTLMIAGEHDVLIPSCYSCATADRIPGSRFLLIPGAGHNPLVECPDEVLPQVVEFLKSSAAPQGAVDHTFENPNDSSHRLTSHFSGGHTS